MAVAAKTAVNLAGLDKVMIYGVDGSPDIKKELKKPETQIAGTAAQSPINIGKKPLRLPSAYWMGTTMRRRLMKKYS